jgi:superfamily I DNA/RNA helicase
LVTWQQLRRLAAEIVRSGAYHDQYDAVIVDEAQDLDPTVLRLLVGLCRDPGRLFVTADANQSIYGSGFRWTDVHADLRFVGRTGVLRKNYRSTREIGEGAQSYLQTGALDEDLIERSYAHDGGPLPVARTVDNVTAEANLLAQFLRVAARDARLGLGACAVLVPSENAGRSIADRLVSRDIGARFMTGREIDLEEPVVKVITLQSAKGLEFPVVAIAGFLDGALPGRRTGVEPEEAEETHLRERRTMFVAMTRAMRSLLLAMPKGSSPVFAGIEEPYWNVGAY